MKQSKAAKIVDLLAATDLSNKKISEEVGCSAAYVRAVQQRLLGGGMSKADKRYVPEKLRRTRDRYASDPEYRQSRIDNSKRWAASNRDRVNAIQRAYRARAKERGAQI